MISCCSSADMNAATSAGFVASSPDSMPGMCCAFSLDRDVGAHHLVVLVVEDVAVGHVRRADGGIEGVQVLSGLDTVDGRGLWRPTNRVTVDVAGEHIGHVLPAGLAGVRRNHRAGQDRA